MNHTVKALDSLSHPYWPHRKQGWKRRKEDPPEARSGKVTYRCAVRYTRGCEARLGTNQGDAHIGSMSLESLKRTIESEFSLEILLKHRELRLIDQEIAKCQIALEQLRRCQVIPYPAMSTDLEDTQAVISGSGPPMDNKVPHPSPWGVTEGPYARHYAQWLLPDPAFDPNMVDTFSNKTQAGKVGSERTTRGSALEKGNVLSGSRPRRGSSNARLQALPLGHSELREEKGPLLLKRSTDGRMVKLVCTDCRRDNFNSAQGFINHCRIAHNRGYASHEAAALACGVEVENHNSSTTVAESPTATSVKAGLVHPLIRSSRKATSTPPDLMLLSSQRKNVTAPYREARNSWGNPTGVTQTSPTFISRQFSGGINQSASSPFVPSPQTPHLSALFAKTGHGGNLNEMVDQAKTRIDPIAPADHTSEDDDQNEEMEDVSPTPLGRPSLSMRGVVGGAGLSRRPGTCPAPLERTPSNKSIRASRKPNSLLDIFPPTSYDSPYAAMPSGPQVLQPHQADTALHDTTAMLHFSPNTMESHQAPSLISDDDGDEYENTHSESEGPSSADDDEDGERYFEFDIEDHGDEIDSLDGSAAANLGLATTVKPDTPGARRSSALRSPTAIQAGPSATHERHVSFLSHGRRCRENRPKSQRKKNGK